MTTPPRDRTIHPKPESQIARKPAPTPPFPAISITSSKQLRPHNQPLGRSSRTTNEFLNRPAVGMPGSPLAASAALEAIARDGSYVQLSGDTKIYPGGWSLSAQPTSSG